MQLVHSKNSSLLHLLFLAFVLWDGLGLGTMALIVFDLGRAQLALVFFNWPITSLKRQHQLTVNSASIAVNFLQCWISHQHKPT